ncbi:MAG TPA: hypothetical protein VHK63_04760 [Candidatus Limnocylindria bacterium]|nr:hypothetical protein [Candidatus Limnocylindria bacterium]
MDGYTVEQAAEVLGIPQARVWELIARGVLFGAAEGSTDVRVFLRPPATSPAELARDEAPRSADGDRGDGGARVEASPFRELLTEFRSLTERYGQALLALGEARGEVAALRGRVELLEARMDMRLPLRAASTVAWEMPERASDREPDREGPPRERAESPREPAPAEPPHAEAPSVPETPAQGSREAPPHVEPEVEPPRQPPPPLHPDGAPGDELAAEEDVHLGPAAPADAPRRRLTGRRAALAGLADALARAEDPALADLPGAREAAEALAALAREVRESDAGGADPALAETEPGAGLVQASEGAVELEGPPPPESDIELQAAFAAPMPDLADEPAVPSPEVNSDALGDEPTPISQAAGPPSPYSTDVVEPDWFADGDFTWLEASEQAVEVEDADDERPEPVAEPAASALETEPEPEQAGGAEPEDAAATPAADSEQEAQPEPIGEREDSDEPQHRPELEPDEVEAEAEPAPEVQHVAREDEMAAVEAIQDAFEEPVLEQPEVDAQASDQGGAEAGPSDDATSPTEVEHVVHEDQTAAVEAVQDAFDEPAGDPWPQEDRGSNAGSSYVGFGLFREEGSSPPAAADRPAPAPARMPPTTTGAPDEEALLWFGDEFEAAELEVAAPGWRDREQPQPEPSSAPEGASRPPVEDDDDDLEPTATEESWAHDEVEAIRAFLGRPPDIDERTEEPPTDSEPQRSALSEPASSSSWTPSPSADQDWLRGRRGAAASAYRRLRRLFPA